MANSPEKDSSRFEINNYKERIKEVNNFIVDSIKRRSKYRFSCKTILYSIFWFPKLNWKWRRKSKDLHNF